MSDDRSAGDEPPAGRGGGTADAYSIIGYLLAGLILYGGLGLLVDHWLGTRFFVLVGLLLGGGLAMYVVYVRYGKT